VNYLVPIKIKLSAGQRIN